MADSVVEAAAQMTPAKRGVPEVDPVMITSPSGDTAAGSKRLHRDSAATSGSHDGSTPQAATDSATKSRRRSTSAGGGYGLRSVPSAAVAAGGGGSTSGNVSVLAAAPSGADTGQGGGAGSASQAGDSAVASLAATVPAPFPPGSTSMQKALLDDAPSAVVDLQHRSPAGSAHDPVAREANGDGNGDSDGDGVTAAGGSPAGGGRSQTAKQRMFPQRASLILNQWYYDHLPKPYPNRDEILRLSSETQLSEAQVAGWMANKRRRSRQLFGIPEASVRALKGWFETHLVHPYPTEADIARLSTECGLPAEHVSTWFQQARNLCQSRIRQAMELARLTGPVKPSDELPASLAGPSHLQQQQQQSPHPHAQPPPPSQHVSQPHDRVLAGTVLLPGGSGASHTVLAGSPLATAAAAAAATTAAAGATGSAQWDTRAFPLPPTALQRTLQALCSATPLQPSAPIVVDPATLSSLAAAVGASPAAGVVMVVLAPTWAAQALQQGATLAPDRWSMLASYAVVAPSAGASAAAVDGAAPVGLSDGLSSGGSARGSTGAGAGGATPTTPTGGAASAAFGPPGPPGWSLSAPSLTSRSSR